MRLADKRLLTAALSAVVLGTGCAGSGISARQAARQRTNILKPVYALRPLPDLRTQVESCRGTARWEDIAGNPEIPGAVYTPAGAALAEREKTWYCGSTPEACLKLKPPKDEKTGNIILDENCFDVTFNFYMRALGSGETGSEACELFMKGGDIQNASVDKFCTLLRGAVERGEKALCSQVMETVPGMALRCASLVASAGGKPGCADIEDKAARERCLEAIAIRAAFAAKNADLCEGRMICLALFADPQVCAPPGSVPRPEVLARAKDAYCGRKAQTEHLAAVGRLHAASLKAIDELNALAIRLSQTTTGPAESVIRRTDRVLSEIQGSILELRQNIGKLSSESRPPAP